MRRPRWRRPTGRRVAVVAGLVVLVLVLAVVVDGWLLARRSPTIAVPDTRDGGGTAYLLLGSDSRERLEGEDAREYADAHQATGERADVVMLLRVPEDRGPEAAELLNVPRDLWVRPTGGGSSYRLGISLDRGPDALVDNLCADLGIGVDHTLVIDFRGLIDVVDALGGVTVSPGLPTRDAEAGLDLPEAGPQVVGGHQALAWVRSREAEVRRDGSWVAAPWDPTVRTGHALDVVTQVVRGLDDPVTVQRVGWAAGPHLRRDDRLGPVAVVELARGMRAALRAERVTTVPVELTRTQVPIGFPTEGTDAALEPFRSPGCGPSGVGG